MVQRYSLNAGALQGANLDAQMAFPGGIKPFFDNWRVSDPTTIDGHEMYVLQGSRISGFLATFYFDKQTGLLARMVRYAQSAVGRVPAQIDFADYRPVAGVTLKRVFGWVSGREECTITEILPNIAVDEARFTQLLAASQ